MKRILFIILSLFVFSCNNGGDKDIYSVYESYPLNIDNYWIYTGTLEFIFSDESQNKTIIEDHTVTVVDIISSPDGEDVYKLKIESSQVSEDDNPEPWYGEAYRYFQNHGDGLYYYGNEFVTTSSPPLPKYIEQKQYKIGEFILSGSQLVDMFSLFKRDITWEENPLQSIKYPISFNSTWNYRDEGEPFKMDKQIISNTDTSFTIQTIYDVLEIDAKHIHSLNGLVSHTSEINNIDVATEEFPDGTGEVLTVKYNFHLTDCNIE